jgi:hypothetical protein
MVAKPLTTRVANYSSKFEECFEIGFKLGDRGRNPFESLAGFKGLAKGDTKGWAWI